MSNPTAPQTADQPSDEETALRTATVARIMETAGIHRCPNTIGVPAYCGCAPGRCDALGAGKTLGEEG